MLLWENESGRHEQNRFNRDNDINNVWNSEIVFQHIKKLFLIIVDDFRCCGASTINSASNVQLLGTFYSLSLLASCLFVSVVSIHRDILYLLQAKPEDTADFCRFLNDDMAGVISKHPDRFVGLGTLPMQAPELAVEEIKRCKHDLGEKSEQLKFGEI